MRFIIEFEIERYQFEDAWHKAGLQNKKQMLQSDLGDLISESFGWQNPVNGNDCHHRLEIEAFPMDKWIEFKKELFTTVQQGMFPALNEIKILELIKELESFGKPAGDTIINKTDK